MKIMIVDDNAGMRELIRSILWEESFEFEECSDGTQALERYSAFRPDWVFMDLSMEGMDGISTIEALKVRDPHAKIIIVTDYNDKPLRQLAEKHQVEAYILKENLPEIRMILGGKADSDGSS